MNKDESRLHEDRQAMYVSKWSAKHAGVGFQFNESKSAVTYAGAALGPKACRAVTPIPDSGQWFFEIKPKCEPNKPEGNPLGGNTFIGICGAPFGCWDSAWWEENRAENESYVWGLWDRGTLTRPSHDRQRDWLENSRFRSGDTIGILVDMDKRRMTMYRNGALMKDQGGQYQEGIFLNIGRAEQFPDGFWPLIVLGDRFHQARLSFRPMWVQILQSSLPEHSFPRSPEHARIGSPNGRRIPEDTDEDAFVKKLMGLGASQSKEEKKPVQFGRRERSGLSPGSCSRSRSPLQSPKSPKATGQDPMDETSCQDVAQVLVFESPEQNHPPHASPFEPSRAAQCEVASPSSTKQKKSRRHRQRQVVQVGQRIELSEQGREYDKRVWGMLSKGGQGTVTQVNLDQDVCWVLWDSTKQTGAYHSVHFDWMLISFLERF